MKVLAEINSVSHSQFATGALYAGVIGLMVSDLIPTPADAVYFNSDKKLREKRESGTLTPEEYLEKSASNYYVYNAVWWGLVALTTFYTKGSTETKLMVLCSLIGGGAVASVLYTNVKKDKQELDKAV